jgi:ribulose-5-phosphate 4-epimerase/fuculose-1-phosphate aldolase
MRISESGGAKVAVETQRSMKDLVSAEEWDLRVQLAAAHRLAEKYGMAELIYTHISLRVPGPTPTYLFKPHSLLFNEITASNLVRVDLEGNPMDGSGGRVNPFGTTIHSAILESRSDVNCVFHTHSPYAVAVSATEDGLMPLTQAALRFAGKIAYHDYPAESNTQLERSQLAEDMGNASVMLMRNHGVLTTGRTVGEAFIAAFFVERAAMFQVLAKATGSPLIIPPHEQRNRQRPAERPTGIQEDAWPALVRQLDLEDSSYKE